MAGLAVLEGAAVDCCLKRLKCLSHDWSLEGFSEKNTPSLNQGYL